MFFQGEAGPRGQPYVFVMEDLSNGRLVGKSAIYSKVGGFEPVYTYEIKTAVHESRELGIRTEIRVLHLRKDHDGPTEIGSLFLDPNYWGHGHGRLLSLSRFLFMAKFPEHFEQEIIAELRGVVHRDGRSPLWEAVGAHFFEMGFPRAETLTSESKRFIADLMPRHPIYIPLLPPEAQEVIGIVHRNTRPALALLQQEGFEFRDIVDIFDGGPAVHAQVGDVRVIRDNIATQVEKIEPAVSNGRTMIISNDRLEFRCCLGQATCHDEGATIDQVTALRLNVKVGDCLRLVDVKPATLPN